MGTEPVDVETLLELAEGQEWSGLPAETVIGHVHFHVSDLGDSQRFYCGLLGFDIALDARESMRALFISAGGYHHHIGLNIWAGQGAAPPSRDAIGLEYATIVYPSEAALELATARLQDGGAEVRDADGQLEVTDPSGITLRLVAASAA